MSTVKDAIDKLEHSKFIKDILSKQLSTISKEYKEAEAEVIELLSEQGLTRGDNDSYNVYLRKSVVPQVTDWDEFYDFIIENKFVHLLEKRPAVLAYRELLHSGKQVPGVEPFDKTTLSLRKK